jgi:hypothetical protein
MKRSEYYRGFGGIEKGDAGIVPATPFITTSLLFVTRARAEFGDVIKRFYVPRASILNSP